VNQTTDNLNESVTVMTPEEEFANEAERIVCQSDRVAVSCVRSVLALEDYRDHITNCNACHKVEACSRETELWTQVHVLNKEAMSALRLTKRGLVR